jgi:hypothetical protein
MRCHRQQNTPIGELSLSVLQSLDGLLSNPAGFSSAYPLATVQVASVAVVLAFFIARAKQTYTTAVADDYNKELAAPPLPVTSASMSLNAVEERVMIEAL